MCAHLHWQHSLAFMFHTCICTWLTNFTTSALVPSSFSWSGLRLSCSWCLYHHIWGLASSVVRFSSCCLDLKSNSCKEVQLSAVLFFLCSHRRTQIAVLSIHILKKDKIINLTQKHIILVPVCGFEEVLHLLITTGIRLQCAGNRLCIKHRLVYVM